MSYWYLGTPYTDYPGGRAEAFVMACGQTTLLMKYGIPVLSPIAHSHALTLVSADLSETDHDFWMRVDKPLMEAARGMIFLYTHGSESSRGMLAEFRYFKAAGKPILPMVPGQVPTYFLGRDV